MAPRWIGAAAIALFAVPAQNSLPAWAQEDKGQYIKTIFMAHIGELPGMAWMMAPNAIITNKKSESVILYTRSDSIEEVRYARAYSEVEIDKIRRKHCLALVPGRFYQYHRSRDGGRIPPKQDRALYTKTSFEGDVKAGHSDVNLEDKGLTHVVGLAEFRERPSLHNYFAIRVTGSTYIYSFHGLYDRETKELYSKGVILHGPDGHVLAKQFWDQSSDTVCDGCSLPVYSDSMVDLFPIINSFHIPQFKYPLLMLDTSTIEGRALSFVTFSPDGTYSEYRKYEYVVGCLLSR